MLTVMNFEWMTMLRRLMAKCVLSTYIYLSLSDQPPGQSRKGQVLHIHQSFFAFLHNREITEHGGVFVTRARSLTSVAPKNMLKPGGGPDLSKMNPAVGGAVQGGFVGSGAMGRGPRDYLI